MIIYPNFEIAECDQRMIVINNYKFIVTPLLHFLHQYYADIFENELAILPTLISYNNFMGPHLTYEFADMFSHYFGYDLYEIEEYTLQLLLFIV